MREEPGPSSRTRAALAAAAAVLLVLVVLPGWYQWSHRARSPIDLVKGHFSEETGAAIGESIEQYLRSEGTEIVSEGFKPSWGAEETSDDVFVVAYVYEVGRDARWVSWEVDTATGEVRPLDDKAWGLW